MTLYQTATKLCGISLYYAYKFCRSGNQRGYHRDDFSFCLWMASVRIHEGLEMKLPEGSCMHMFKTDAGWLLAETVARVIDQNTYKWPLHVGVSLEHGG